jgi:hypothetical protein
VQSHCSASVPTSLPGCWCHWCRGLSCIAGPSLVCYPLPVLLHDMVAAQHSFLGAGATGVRDSAVWLVPSLACYLRAVCAMTQQCGGAQHSFLGAGATGVGNSAVWLVPTLACYLLAVCAIAQQCGEAQHSFVPLV